jgi:hypothetical protein
MAMLSATQTATASVSSNNLHFQPRLKTCTQQSGLGSSSGAEAAFITTVTDDSVFLMLMDFVVTAPEGRNVDSW